MGIINKINDFNNFMFNGYNTTTNKTQTNRNKLNLLNKKFNKIIKFK